MKNDPKRQPPQRCQGGGVPLRVGSFRAVAQSVVQWPPLAGVLRTAAAAVAAAVAAVSAAARRPCASCRTLSPKPVKVVFPKVESDIFRSFWKVRIWTTLGGAASFHGERKRRRGYRFRRVHAS